MKIKPLEDRVVIKPEMPDEKVQGGIIIPDTAREKPQKGKVTAIGPGKMSETGTKIPMNVKVGDTVLYGKYSGTEITIDEEELLILRESDIFAII